MRPDAALEVRRDNGLQDQASREGLPLERVTRLLARIDPEKGTIDGVPSVARRLSSLRGCFADAAAYAAASKRGDPVIYTVSTVEPAEGAGQLSYGVGMITAGRIGAEYHLTKGHLHAWRAAAELYVGLRGTGHMLLEDEATRESRLVPLRRDEIVYVPGHTAHRTINTGEEPLIYLGIYPTGSGHDYAHIASRNFKKVVVTNGGEPALMDRHDFAGSDGGWR